MIASVMRPWMPVDSRSERDTTGQTHKRPLTMYLLVRGLLCGVWQVKDSNLRRLSRRIYSPLPLAARATCRVMIPTWTWSWINDAQG